MRPELRKCEEPYAEIGRTPAFHVAAQCQQSMTGRYAAIIHKSTAVDFDVEIVLL